MIKILDKSGLLHFWDNIKSKFIPKPIEEGTDGLYLKFTTNGTQWASISSALIFKGTKSTYSEIEALTDAQNGDVWACTEGSAEYVRVGNTWEQLGPSLTGYLNQSNLSSSNPLMNGTASAGTSTLVSREDHVHPSDTSKQNTLIAGDNINITENVISAEGYIYNSNSNLNSFSTINALALGLDSFATGIKQYITESNITLTGPIPSSDNNIYNINGTVTSVLLLKGKVIRIVQGTNIQIAKIVQIFHSEHIWYAKLDKTVGNLTNLTFNYVTGVTYGEGSFVNGTRCIASGTNSFAFGEDTIASGTNSFAFGEKCIALLPESLAGGYYTLSDSNASLVFGYCENQDYSINTTGTGSITIGKTNDGGQIYTSGVGSMTLGRAENNSSIETSADGTFAFGYVFGEESSILGAADGSFVFGSLNHNYNKIISSGEGSVAFGYINDSGTFLYPLTIKSDAHGSFAGGYIANSGNTGIISDRAGSMAFGYSKNEIITAVGLGSIALGEDVKASGEGAFACGILTAADGKASHTEGYGVWFTTHDSDYSLSWSGTTGILDLDTDMTLAREFYFIYDERSNSNLNLKIYDRTDKVLTTFTINSISVYTGSLYIDFNPLIDYRQHYPNYTFKINITVGSELDNTDVDFIDITRATKQSAHAEGKNTKAIGKNSHAEGLMTSAQEDNSHAEGHMTIANGDNSHAEGYRTITSGKLAHTEGATTTASGENAHAEGLLTTAYGKNSHAEGKSSFKYHENIITIPKIINTWNEHDDTTKYPFSYAYGIDTHVEGKDCLALGAHSHAEGQNTKAYGEKSHAEGSGCIAGLFDPSTSTLSGNNSHAEGDNTLAKGFASHAEGSYTIAASSYLHVEGRNNIIDTLNKYLHIVGNGYSNSERRNAFAIKNNNMREDSSISLFKVNGSEISITATQLELLLALLN